MNRHEIESQLIEKASADPASRQRLLDDPKAAIADLLGVELPPGMRITVLEETPGQHYLVLPPAPPSLDALPLDDLDLALVGGGRTLRPHKILVSGGNTRAANRPAVHTSQSSC
ncbi:MAG: NHLP leader peptide family RiPP precursor [Caldilineaceae bacterium]|nr:NHLP leader peptide family RiPP precursor [Caldilineaceae bacterium]